MSGRPRQYCYQLFLLILVLLPLKGHTWGWFSSSTPSSSSSSKDHTYYPDSSRNSVAKFSMEGLNNPKGAELVEDAKRKSLDTNSCWQSAYHGLLDVCSKGLAEDEKKSRFAWQLSDCFQRKSGRSAFPYCDTKTSMDNCRKSLQDSELAVFLEFYLEANNICHQLQAYAFKVETERLVNDLKKSSEHAEDKLESILERSETLAKSSDEIHDSLSSIDARTQQLAQASKSMEDHIEAVLNHSEAIFEQSQGIAATQSELQKGQTLMKDQLDQGMVKIHDSHNMLGQSIEKLMTGTVEIEKEIIKVRDGMFVKMENLQGKADDIGNIAGISLEKQKELLVGQSTAIEGLQFLTKSQSEALEESRSSLQKLAEYSSSQQEELLARQAKLHQVHDHLVENSKFILAAQEEFEAKQASMFLALEKLFALQNAMLLESRLIKAFFIYTLLVLVIYMFTSTKQTYNVRPWLYIGVCITLSIEVAVLRLTCMDVEQQTDTVNYIRNVFVVIAVLVLLYAVFTFRDYEVLNHKILLNLMDKVNKMQMENDEDEDGYDSDINWSENVSISEDPDYILPADHLELVEEEENSVTSASCTSRYNLRQRSRRNYY